MSIPMMNKIFFFQAVKHVGGAEVGIILGLGDVPDWGPTFWCGFSFSTIVML